MQTARGTYRGNMEPALPHSIQSGGEIGPNSQTPLSTRDQQITALPLHSFRDSTASVVLASQAKAYGRTLSHHPHPSTSSNVSHDPFTHRRRGSTLRVVMRKIFGKKRYSNLDEDEVTEESPVLRAPGANAADLALLGPDRMFFETKPASIFSNNDPAGSNGNKSHPSSASSDDVVALASGDKRIEIANHVIRRRATLPSLILTEDGETRKSIYSASSPPITRPASAIDEHHEEEHEEDVRSQPSFKTHRRSRSAGALQELVQRHRMSPIQWRRLTGETKPSETSDFDIVQHATKEKQPHANPSNAPAAVATPENIDDRGDSPRSEIESAPFQFENLIANMADPDLTVEQRLTTIEVKLMDLEFAIAKIQGTDANVFSKPAEKPTEQNRVEVEVDNEEEDHSNGPSSSSIASETSSQSSLSFGGVDRPISMATLRPNMVYDQQVPMPWQTNSWSSSMNLHGISIEQYSALVTLVRREQTARKALENTVAQLQEEMQQLRRTSGLPASPPGTLYPIPSPDSETSRFHRRRRPTSSSRKNSSTSADTKASDSRSRDSPNNYRSTKEVDPRNTPNMI